MFAAHYLFKETKNSLMFDDDGLVDLTEVHVNELEEVLVKPFISKLEVIKWCT